MSPNDSKPQQPSSDTLYQQLFQTYDGFGEAWGSIPRIPTQEECSPNFDSPGRAHGEGAGFIIPIGGTNFVAVLWTNHAAMETGIWNYHIAHESTPNVPISFLDLYNRGWYPAYHDNSNDKWVSELDSGIAPIAGAKTRVGAEGEVVVLMHQGKNYFATSPFPRAPLDPKYLRTAPLAYNP